MNIVQLDAKLLSVGVEPKDVITHIERCGRVCYKSEDRISEDSSVRFARAMIKNGHEAMLEHGTIILLLLENEYVWFHKIENNARQNGVSLYLKTTQGRYQRHVVSGNVRAWRDFLAYASHMGAPVLRSIYSTFERYTPLFDDVLSGMRMTGISTVGAIVIDPSWTDPSIDEEIAHRRLTILFTVPRGITHEFVRHRPASFAQESTRYCNYSKGKFGREITVIRPSFIAEDTVVDRRWLAAMAEHEAAYFELLNLGLLPQEARGVLPIDLKAELVMTANVEEWLHFLNLRAKGTTGAPHPQAREAAVLAAGELAKESSVIARWAEENL